MRIVLSCSLLFLLAGLVNAQPTKRAAIPDPKAQAKSLQLIHDIFGDDYEQAKAPEAKNKLASTLFQQGKEVKDDPATRFVCFREARDLAAKGGDFSLAMVVIDELNRLYEVDALLQKADVLGLAVASATEKEAGLALVDVIRPLLNEAIDLDHYKAAHQLGDALVNAAKKARSPSLVLEVQKRVEEIKEIEKSFGKMQGFLDRVGENPRDQEANFELGKYFGFQKRRWEKALGYFANSGQEPLRILSKNDLADPKDSKTQLELADGYWDLAGASKEPGKSALQIRAMHWYEKALPTLAGINRTKAQKRIDAAAELLAGGGAVTPAIGPVGEVRKFEGHSKEIKGVAFSFDGRYAASASRDKTARVWDLGVKDAKEAFILRGHDKEVWGVAFHPNNRYLFTASWDTTVRMWDFKATNEVKRFKHDKDVNCVVVSRDASTILTGCDDRHAYLWDLNTGNEIKRYGGHAEYVYAAAYSPDGRYIASGSVDKTVRVFDRQSGAHMKTFEGSNESVINVAFLPDNRHVLSSGDNFVRVWDLQTGKEARRFEGHQGRVQAMALSPDGRRLLTGSDDRTMKLWDAQSGKLIHTFAGHTDNVTCVAFSHDGRRAISGSGNLDRSVRIWNLPGR